MTRRRWLLLAIWLVVALAGIWTTDHFAGRPWGLVFAVAVGFAAIWFFRREDRNDRDRAT